MVLQIFALAFNPMSPVAFHTGHQKLGSNFTLRFLRSYMCAVMEAQNASPARGRQYRTEATVNYGIREVIIIVMIIIALIAIIVFTYCYLYIMMYRSNETFASQVPERIAACLEY